MSVKDVRKYYAEISEQYEQMISEIRDFEQEAMNGMFEPEKLDEIKQRIQPLKTNFERIAYIIFLLDKPNKKKKEKSYIKRNKKKLSKLTNATTEAVKEENNEVLKSLRKL